MTSLTLDEHNFLECTPEKALANSHYKCLAGRTFQLKPLQKSEIKMRENRFGQKVSGINCLLLHSRSEPEKRRILYIDNVNEIYATVVSLDWTMSGRLPALFGLIVTELPAEIFYAKMFDFCIYATTHNLTLENK